MQHWSVTFGAQMLLERDRSPIMTLVIRGNFGKVVNRLHWSFFNLLVKL